MNKEEICPVCFEFKDDNLDCSNSECPTNKDKTDEDRVNDTIRRSIR